MSTEHVVVAINQLKDVILADPELSKLVKDVKSPEDLRKLWSSDHFRKAHDQLIAGVKTEDVRSFLDELSDKDLDQVTGGAYEGYRQVASTMTPTQMYSTALYRVLIGL